MPVIATGSTTGQHPAEYGHGSVHSGHFVERIVVEIERHRVALLDLMDQPRQLEGVDALANLLRRAIAVRRQQRDHLIAGHQFTPARTLMASANSPTVMPAISSASSSANFTPYSSSTRTASSATARDSRSIPALPR